LKKAKELSRNAIQNASKPTLKIGTVSNIRAAATEGPKRSYLKLAEHWSYDHYNPSIKQKSQMPETWI
jgi:intein-encoded DNA endonuclease-like protein